MEIESRLQRVERMVLEEPLNILSLTRSHEQTLDFLGRRRLLKSEPICSGCGNLMRLPKKKTKADRCHHRCRGCEVTKSIRYQSIFENSKLSLIEMTRLIFYYFTNG